LIKVEKLKGTNSKKEDVWVDRMAQVNPHALRQDISAAATLKKWKGSGDSTSLVPVIPPDHHIQAIAHKICGDNIPLLYGIINAPTIFADGSMLQEPGYDRRSKLLYNPDGVAFPGVPEGVGRADAEVALAKLRHLFSGFPFVDAIDESVAIAGLLTAPCRKSFDVAPAFAASAPEFGSGKSFLVDCIHMVAFGTTAPVIDATADDDEFRKRLETELMQGAAAIAFDNVTATLGGDTFSSMLTSEFIKPRKLGGHTAIELPTNVFITITGNHLKIRADLIRRVLQSRIDAAQEDPWKRKFKFNPIELIRKERGEYVGAVLTILRAYHVSGRTVNFASNCSYEEWTKLVRGAVVWLGLPDPFESVDMVSKDDPDKSDMRAIMENWARTMDLHETTVAKIVAKACEMDHNSTNGGDITSSFVYPEFHSTLIKVAGKNGFIDSARLGYRMREHQDIVIDYRKFTSCGMTKGVTRWKMIELERRSEARQKEKELPF
jgi:putative DNA primase/helicase